MVTAVRHAGRVDEKGNLVLLDPAAWRVAVSKHKGRTVWVSVVRQSSARTMNQNKLYWVWVHEIAEYIGDDDQAVHEFLKAKYLRSRDVELLDGKHLTLPPSTKHLTVEQFGTYMNAIQAGVAQFLGLVLPEANRLEVIL